MGFKNWKTKTIHIDSDARLFHHYSISQNKLCIGLRNRIRAKKDSTVLITAPTGFGKSTLVGKLCFNFFSELDNLMVEGDKMYDDDDFVVDPEDYAAKMITYKGRVIFWDESRDGLSSKNWNSKINKTIISRKNKNRKRGIVSFILLPYEEEVDKSFLKHVTMWIYIKKRGVGEVYVANNSRKGGQALSVDRIVEREEKYYKENPGKRVVRPTIHPEYIGNIYFGAFSKAEDKRYNDLVEKHHASGKLTDEEEEKINPIVDEKELEKEIPLALNMVESGEIKSKRDLWDKLKEITKFDDALLIRHINRHLKIRGFKNFNSFVI